MVHASDLGYRLADGRDILVGLDFALLEGSFLAVVGENGAGKTTLLDLLMGFRRRTRGHLAVLDQGSRDGSLAGPGAHRSPLRARGHPRGLDWGLYYLGLLVSIGLLMQSNIWSTLDTERIVHYVPKGQRVWAWAKIFVITFGVIGLLVVAWLDLPTHPSTGSTGWEHLGPFRSLYWAGASRLLFPAGAFVVILWARQNARRWCVTL